MAASKFILMVFLTGYDGGSAIESIPYDDWKACLQARDMINETRSIGRDLGAICLPHDLS